MDTYLTYLPTLCCCPLTVLCTTWYSSFWSVTVNPLITYFIQCVCNVVRDKFWEVVSNAINGKNLLLWSKFLSIPLNITDCELPCLNHWIIVFISIRHILIYYSIKGILFYYIITQCLSFFYISHCFVEGVIVILHSLSLPTSVTGEVYCFPRQLIFSFGRRALYHSKCIWEYIAKSIPPVCTMIFKLIAGLLFLS